MLTNERSTVHHEDASTGGTGQDRERSEVHNAQCKVAQWGGRRRLSREKGEGQAGDFCIERSSCLMMKLIAAMAILLFVFGVPCVCQEKAG
jgi:hypothetical protein